VGCKETHREKSFLFKNKNHPSVEKIEFHRKVKRSKLFIDIDIITRKNFLYNLYFFEKHFQTDVAIIFHDNGRLDKGTSI
jgi:hypothetical protein